MKPELLEQLLEALRRKREACLVRWLDSGEAGLWVEGRWTSPRPLPPGLECEIGRALREGRGRLCESAGERLFLQVFQPPLRLIVVGAVHIAQALVPMAGLLGYRTVVVDPRRAFASRERFPGTEILDEWPDEALAALDPDRRTAVVVLTHDPKLDDPALVAALRSEAFYIGALGSRRTHAKRIARLRAMGLDAEELARIHAPIGLDIGAVSPAEIALSILAEITCRLRGGPRRDRTAASGEG